MLDSPKTRFRYFCLGALTLLLIGSFLPGPLCRKLPYYETCFNLAHVLGYGFLAYLLCFFLSFQRRLGSLRFYEFGLYVSVFLIILTVGTVVEGLQQLAIERRTDPFDVLLNQIGCLIGMMIFGYVHHRSPRTSPVPKALGARHRVPGTRGI